MYLRQAHIIPHESFGLFGFEFATCTWVSVPISPQTISIRGSVGMILFFLSRRVSITISERLFGMTVVPLVLYLFLIHSVFFRAMGRHYV
jgi:hypothetical protein